MKAIEKTSVPEIVRDDAMLLPYRQDVEMRMANYHERKQRLTGGASLAEFANGYLFYGLHPTQDGWIYREWAPNADALHLVGDFNGWNTQSHPLTAIGNGNWEIRLQGRDAVHHLDWYKVLVSHHGKQEYRIPLYADYVVQNPNGFDFCARVWCPNEDYVWHDGAFCPNRNEPPIIYECHVGMATEEYRIGTYEEFRTQVLPYIRQAGYNTVQLMAIMQYPYYGSFGYQVGSFFAPSSWYGTPNDLKHLIDDAHGMGISVLLDLVHSHAVKNPEDGILGFDGTETQFFKAGAAGNHPAWDSKVFDYGNDGVVHFLLSNIKYWLEMYHFDGYRFDGVTSMLYHNHGLGEAFVEYGQYFSMNTDIDAVGYLQLACETAHAVKPQSICIAEDMSGMPGLCKPVRSGGIGFDYRLNMGIPDYYIKLLKEYPLGAFPVGQIFYELVSHRGGEKAIAYAESHDQALVGDKTLIFRMADAEMYADMNHGNQNVKLEQALAMHKILRLLTISAGGMGYLNFMGNEFGHPEWIDFPREGNGWSYQYARRQWSLLHNPFLRYGDLAKFDQAMLHSVKQHGILQAEWAHSLRQHQDEQLMVFERNGCVFAFNLHPTYSQKDCYIPVPFAGKWKVVLSTDEPAFGGYGNVDTSVVYEARQYTDDCGFTLYLPALCGVMLAPVKEENRA